MVISLDTEHYLLRTMTVDDASDRWASWFSDPYVIEMLNLRAAEWTRESVVKYIKQFDQRSNHLLGIFEKQEGKLIGIWTLRINHQTKRCLLNLLIGEPDHRGKSALRETRTVLYGHLFGDLGLDMMQANALGRNNIIITTMLKRGWTLERTLKNHIKSNSDGTMLDLCQFSYSREAWLASERGQPPETESGGNPTG